MEEDEDEVEDEGLTGFRELEVVLFLTEEDEDTVPEPFVSHEVREEVFLLLFSESDSSSLSFVLSVSSELSVASFLCFLNFLLLPDADLLLESLSFFSSFSDVMSPSLPYK